jgi:inner membrane protein involved in colicin E2 resistance
MKMDKEEFNEKTYKDEQGYLRWKDSKKRVSRTIAYKEIYLKNKKKYPLKFEDYQVHHIDKNKENNKVENLKLVERGEHEKEHGIVRREKLDIIFIRVIALGLMCIFVVEIITRKYPINQMTQIGKALIFLGILLLSIATALWLSREKEGVKYI